MTLQRDRMCAFSVAVLLHGIGALCADTMLSRMHGIVRPAFQRGESGLDLTIVGLDQVRPVFVEPAPPERAALVQERSAVVLEPASLPPEREPEEPLRADTLVVDQRGDADPFDKGVSTAVLPLGEIRPRYPLAARLRCEQGLVELSIRIDADGNVRDVRIAASSGHISLDRAAERAVRSARFGDELGKPPGRETETNLRIEFRLTE